MVSNKILKNCKKGSGGLGVAIIAMAALLLLGSFFVDDGSISKNDYINDKNENDNNGNYRDSYPSQDYLFYLNSTDLGRQSKVTESFPNIEIGSKIESNVIFIGNPFKIKANPFSKTFYTFEMFIDEPENVNNFLVYFDPERITGKQNLVVKVNGEEFYRGQGASNDVPISINKKLASNQSRAWVTFELEKPRWYSLFNWNTYEVTDLRVVEVSQDKSNNIKEFDFQVEKDFLERVELNMVVDCEDSATNKPIKASVNGYIIADFNPECDKYSNVITREVPINILKSDKNTVKFESNGYYKLAYSVNKIYFNDDFTYKFTINSFNDIIDVVMYGDFDVSVLDLRLNGQTIALKRDEIVSIIPYLKFGVNEIKFLSKPVEIDEFIIEKNEFLY